MRKRRGRRITKDGKQTIRNGLDKKRYGKECVVIFHALYPTGCIVGRDIARRQIVVYRRLPKGKRSVLSLRPDLRDDADKVNRVYELDLDNVQDVVISNGYEDVTVKALILGDYTDKAPARSGSDVEE